MIQEVYDEYMWEHADEGGWIDNVKRSYDDAVTSFKSFYGISGGTHHEWLYQQTHHNPNTSVEAIEERRLEYLEWEKELMSGMRIYKRRVMASVWERVDD